MPLLISPIDGSPMKQINRFGIELDVCPTSGGIWLDRGELEKLMAMLREAAAEEQSSARDYDREPPREAYRPPERYDSRYDSRPPAHDKYHDPRYGKHGYKKKKSKLFDVLDIFDF